MNDSQEDTKTRRHEELKELKGIKLSRRIPFVPSCLRVRFPRIATCLSSLDALINAENHKLEALKTHKKGLMHHLFPSPEEVAI